MKQILHKALALKALMLSAVLALCAGNAWADTYQKYSGTITPGKYLIVFDGGALKASVTNSRLDYDAVAEGDAISSTNASIVWTIAASGDYFTLYNESTESYAAGTGAKNKAQLLSDGTDDKSLWTITGEETYEFVNKANDAANVNKNLRRNGSYGFACYAIGTGGALTLYKLEESSGGGDTPTLENCDLALEDAPVELEFDLYNNASAKVINYTTSSTGAVSINNSEYATFAIDAVNKTITVTPKAKTSGAETITVNQAADETYNVGSTTFTLTITDSTPKTGGWVLTDLANLTAEDVFVIVGDNTYALPNNGTDSAPSVVEVTIENDEITSDVEDNIKWNISGDAENGYTFYPNGTTETWLFCNTTASSSNNNNMRVGTGDRKKFALSGDNLVTNDTYTDRYVSIYNNSDWRGYTNTNSAPSISFYKYESNAAVKNPVIAVENSFIGSTTASITCSTDGATIYYSYDNENWTEYTDELTITETTTIYAKAVKDDDNSEVVSKTTTRVLPTPTVTIDATGITNTNVFEGTEAGSLAASVTYNDAAVDGAVVTWSGNNDAVATINAETGAVTLVAAGSVTFTATYAGNSDYSEKTATYDMTVTNIDPNTPGTENNPYTIVQAKAAIDAGEGVNGVYVKGIISQIDSYNYGTITYWISDDGSTTNQFEVYRGKGLENTNFTAVTDLEVGDNVVVYGNIMLYSYTTYEFTSGNYLVSRIEKPASDLAKTNDIVLDFKNNNTVADVTKYITSSSTGAYSFEVGDNTIITNEEELIEAIAVGETTVTVNQAADASYKAGSVVINVTVQDTREAATTIPAINIESLKVGDADGSISVVDPVKADEGVTFTFESSDENVLLIDGTTYTVGNAGTTTVTVTATASDNALYKNVVAEFEVTVSLAVKNENEIEVDIDPYTTVYGTELKGLALAADGYDGELVVESSNPAVATVAIDEEGNVTVTPVAVGSTNITFSAAETGLFNAAEDVVKTVTVTAPEALTEAPDASEQEVELDFIGTDWGFPTYNVTAEASYTDGTYTVTLGATASGEGHKLMSGTALLMGKNGATLQLPIFNGTVSKIDVVGASGASGKVTQNIYVGEIAVSEATTGAKGTNTYKIDKDYQAAGTIYTLKVTNSNNTQISSITIYVTPNISAKATIASSGYGTLCSIYPLDFTATVADDSDYKAWYVSGIDGNNVMLEQVTGAIAGGEAVILCGNPGTYDVPAVSSSEYLNDNLLEGTLAPTVIGANEAYGMSQGQFKLINAGTLPAGKAYLPASALDSSIKAYTLVFNDATGIQSTEVMNSNNEYYNLAGQRIARPTKGGIYIMNGKKVVIK